jgi:geranylgeranyl pyrophosphate synthase
LPTLLALRSSPHADELRALIDKGLDSEADQQRAIALVLDSTGQSESLAMADAYVAQAITHLELLPPSPAREALAELAHFAARRRR